MNITYLFGGLATFTSLIGLLPQVYHTYRTKSARDVSMLMLCNYLICSVSWIIYGIYTDAQFVLWSNIMGLTCSLISICQKRYYDAR